MIDIYIRLRFLIGACLILIYNKLKINNNWIKCAIERIGIFDIKSFYENNILITVVLRKNSSDNLVFQQIFKDYEYLPVLKLNKIIAPSIIDGGANIGLTTCYLKAYYPNSKFLCVEPDLFNSDVLKLNLSLNRVNSIIIKGGLWGENKNLELNKSFRDGKNWSYSVEENLKGNIKGYTLSYLAKKYFKNSIDIIKLDIEGAERYVFDESINLKSVLINTKVIVVEIHDEYNIEDSILSFLEKNCLKTTVKYGQSFFATDN